MKNKLIFTLLISLFSLRAMSFEVNFTNSAPSVVGAQEIHVENMTIANVLEPVWGHFQWNPQTNSLELVDFGTTKPEAPVVGNWALKYDWGCHGSASSAEWHLQDNGTFTDSQGYHGIWELNGNDFKITYKDTGTAIYSGQLSNGTLSGTMEAGSYKGCWSATKINSLSTDRNEGLGTPANP